MGLSAFFRDTYFQFCDEAHSCKPQGVMSECGCVYLLDMWSFLQKQKPKACEQFDGLNRGLYWYMALVTLLSTLPSQSESNSLMHNWASFAGKFCCVLERPQSYESVWIGALVLQLCLELPLRPQISCFNLGMGALFSSCLSRMSKTRYL